jgi:hypothetical protein
MFQFISAYFDVFEPEYRKNQRKLNLQQNHKIKLLISIASELEGDIQSTLDCDYDIVMTTHTQILLSNVSTHKNLEAHRSRGWCVCMIP